MKKTIITPEADSLWLSLKKIWKYRELAYSFAIRDLKVKYAQTWLGVGWSVIQPLTALLIFTFFFGYILHWKAEGLPYSLYVLSGLLGWNFFSYIVYQGVSSIQGSSHLIKKIYFPKSILPISKVYVAFVELIISFILLIPLMFWFKEELSWKLIFIPLALFFNILAALSIVFFANAFAYKKKDVYHLVPFLMYFGIWVTPVFFTKNILPESLSVIWYLNPMASIVELWRWSLFSNLEFDLFYIPSLIVLLPLFLIGLWLFVKAERKFSDFL